MKHAIRLLILALVLLPITSTSVAQFQGTGNNISRWTVSGGGVTASERGGFTLNSTIGQPDAGVWAAGGYTLSGGLWGTRRQAVGTPLASVEIVGPASGQANAPHTFVAAVSPVTATAPITYVWQATGQAPVIHAGALSHTDAVSFTWSVTGTQSVTVTASNVVSARSATATITIAEYTAPVAAFAASPLSGAVPLEVQFTDQSTGDITSWDWDFGDGSVSGARHPAHTYQDTGTYTVSLTVTGPAGSDTETKVDYITASYTGKTWTFMLYFAGDNDLGHYLRSAIDRIERVANKPNVNILVLWDGLQSGDTRLYKVEYDGSPGIASPAPPVLWNPGELNTGSTQTLVDFVDWARDEYPADHYFLSIADHGRGTTGIAWDYTSGKDNLSAYSELAGALDAISDGGSDGIDVLYFDACLMGMIEDAYEVKGYVDYLVASENLGWSVFAYDAYVAGVTDDTTPREMAVGVADAYFSALRGLPGTISVLDMSAVEGVGSATDSLAQALRAYLNSSNISQMINIRDYYVQTFDSRDYLTLDSTDEYIDLYHFAELVKTNIGDASVQGAAQGVMDAVANCVIAEHHQSGLALWSRNNWDLDDARGIAIYFPPRRGGWDYNNYVTGGSWEFCNATVWDEFLLDYFRLTDTPPDESIDPGVPPMQGIERVFLPLVMGGE